MTSNLQTPPTATATLNDEETAVTISSYQQMINSKYPFERLLPKNSMMDPDVVMNHILSISFLADQSTIKQQAIMQAAEEYAMQRCMLQCKRDGRMRKEKSTTATNDENTMTIEPSQILAQVEEEIRQGKLSPAEIEKFYKTKAFQAQLEAIPWVDAPVEEPKSSSSSSSSTTAAPAAATTTVSAEPKPFLATSLFAPVQPELTEAQKAEKRFEKSRQQKVGAETLQQQSATVCDETDDLEEMPSELVDAPTQFYGDVSTLSAADLHPAIPEGAKAPEITPEQLALDPNNPAIVPQPIKERDNRFSYAAKFEDLDHLPTEEEIKQKLREKKAAHAEKWQDVDPNVAGFVADGTTIPIRNEGAATRADLPPVYRDGPAHREKVMKDDYDPTQDKPFLWNKRFKKIVVSMIGPDCPQKAPRRLFRVWGGVADDDEADNLMREVVKKNKYGYKWRTYCYSIQRWIEFPPKGDPKKINGTVAAGNNEFEEYLQAAHDHQKHVNVELEQRALDQRAMEKTDGQSIIQQLKDKNMDVNLSNPATFPR